MKFGLDIVVAEGEQFYSLSQLIQDETKAQSIFANPEEVEGAMIPIINGKPAIDNYSDPLLALLEQWMLKLPWILGGDTETIPLRNSVAIFAIESISELVQLSLFVGEPNEVEEYILEPLSVGLETFAEASIQVTRQLVKFLDKIIPDIAKQSADIKTLKEALAEAEKSLKEHRLKR